MQEAEKVTSEDQDSLEAISASIEIAELDTLIKASQIQNMRVLRSVESNDHDMSKLTRTTGKKRYTAPHDKRINGRLCLVRR